MKLFITGGSGFIGSRIAEAAVAKGHTVISLSRSGKPSAAGQWADKAEWLQGSVFEPAAWENRLAGCDAVIHSIGIITEEPEQDITFQRQNHDSALELAAAAQRQNVPKYVMISASGKPPFIPKAYITTKRAAEQELHNYPFQLVILRPSLIYGPGRWWSYLLKAGMNLAQLATLGRSDIPFHARQLGKAVVTAAVDRECEGLYEVRALTGLIAEY